MGFGQSVEMAVCLISMVLASVFDCCMSRAMNVAVMVGDIENEHLIGVGKRVRRESASEKPAEKKGLPFWAFTLIIFLAGLVFIIALIVAYFLLRKKLHSLEALASMRRDEMLAKKSPKAAPKGESSKDAQPKKGKEPEEAEREEPSKSKQPEPATGLKKKEAAPKIPAPVPLPLKKPAGPVTPIKDGPKGVGVSADLEASSGTKESSTRSGSYKKQPKAPLPKQQPLPPGPSMKKQPPGPSVKKQPPGPSVKKQPPGPIPPMKTMKTGPPQPSPRTKYLLNELTGALTTAAKAKKAATKKK